MKSKNKYIRKDMQFKLETTTLQGLLLLAVASITLSNLETSALHLFNLSALIIVVVGTIAAMLISVSAETLKLGLAQASWVLMSPVDDRQSLIGEALTWRSEFSNKGNLESFTGAEVDAFKEKGLLIASEANSVNVKDIMTVESELILAQQLKGAKMWEKAASVAPTIGIIGAILGMSSVMSSVSDLPKLTEGLAQAFIATMYGVGLANFILMPMSNKIKDIIATEYTRRCLMIEAWVSITSKESSLRLTDRLSSYSA